MKRYRFFAAIAVMVLAIGSFAAAQEGYYGQQATTNEPAQQTDSGARLVACACGHMHGDMTAAMRASVPPTASESSKSAHSKPQKHTQDGAASQPEGDPNAVQNQVEYGGGGA